MTLPDADALRAFLGDRVSGRLSAFEVFAEIDSTNGYLMQQPGPLPGRVHVAVTDNQTAGRGRHGRTWLSPPGSGLCLSLAYTFARQPADLPALTLALGLGAIDALESLDVRGVELKWPNDLVAGDGKLGGILTETQAQRGGALTVVTGIGLNVDLGDEYDPAGATDWATGATDLASFAIEVPPRELLAARLVDRMGATFIDYEASGFEIFISKWTGRDWLFGRELMIDMPQGRVTGVGAGVADDGALLVDTGSGDCRQIRSGSIVMAAGRDTVE